MLKRTFACVSFLCFAGNSLVCALEDGTKVNDGKFIDLFANVERRKIENDFDEVYKKFINSFPVNADLKLNFQRIRKKICKNGKERSKSTRLKGVVFHPALCQELERSFYCKDYFRSYLDKRVNERVDYVEKNNKYREFSGSFNLWYRFFKFLLDLTPGEKKDFGKSVESKFSSEEIERLGNRYFGIDRETPWYYSDHNTVERLLIVRRYLKEHSLEISSANFDSVWSRFLVERNQLRSIIEGGGTSIPPKQGDNLGEDQDSDVVVDPGNNNGSQNETRGKEKKTDPSGNFEGDSSINSSVTSYFAGGLVAALLATCAWFRGWFGSKRDAGAARSPGVSGYIRDMV